MLMKINGSTNFSCQQINSISKFDVVDITYISNVQIFEMEKIRKKNVMVNNLIYEHLQYYVLVSTIKFD